MDEAADRLRAAGWPVKAPDGGAARPGLNDFWNLARAGSLVMSSSTFTWWAAVVGDAIAEGATREVAFPSPWQPPTKTFLKRDGWLAITYDGAAA